MTHTIQSVRLLYEAGLSRDAIEQLRLMDDNTDDAHTDAAVAQTSADYASFYLADNYSQALWTTSTGGSWPANTTQNLTVEWLTKSGAAVADRVLLGTRTTSTVAVTAVSNTNTLSGASTAYVLTGDGTNNVRAEITLTLPDASIRVAVLSWATLDLTAASVRLFI